MTSIRKKRTCKPILSMDFDGVIHWYRNGWKGTGVIDDDPVPGAKEFIENAQNYFTIVVFSSRSSTEEGIEAMRIWMEKHGFPKVNFSKDKLKAFLTIDDRAIQFKGEWFDPEELLEFKPWNKE